MSFPHYPSCHCLECRSYVGHRSSLATTSSSSLSHHSWERHMLGLYIRAKGQVGSSSKSQTLPLGSWVFHGVEWRLRQSPLLIPKLCMYMHACTCVHTLHIQKQNHSTQEPKYIHALTHVHIERQAGTHVHKSHEHVYLPVLANFSGASSRRPEAMEMLLHLALHV